MLVEEQVRRRHRRHSGREDASDSDHLGRVPEPDAITWRGADHLDVGIVQSGYDTSVLALYALSAPAAALTVGAPSILLLRTGLLPRWIAWLGLAEVASIDAPRNHPAERHRAPSRPNVQPA